MITDLPLFKAVVCNNGKKGYMLCSYEHALKTRADGSTYYTQVNRRKIADIAGGEKNGLVVFTDDFLSKNPELKKYRVYRDGPNNIYEKIDLAEGESPVVCTVRNARGLQPRGMVKADVEGIPAVTHELVRDANNNLVLKEISLEKNEVPTTSEESNNVPAHLNKAESCKSEESVSTSSSGMVNRTIKSASGYPMSKDPASLVDYRESSDESEDTPIALSYTASELSGGATYVIGQIFDQLGFSDSLLKAGLSKSDVNKLKIITAYTVYHQDYNLDQVCYFTHIFDVSNHPYKSKVPFSTIGKSLSYDVVNKFFDINLARAIHQNSDDSNYLNLVYDGSSLSHRGHLSIAEYGHNKDGDNLPQINFGMICIAGQVRPIYVDFFHGNINDVVIFQKFTNKISECNCSNAKITVVADRGCYSTSNVDDLLRRGIDFVLHIPKYGAKVPTDENSCGVNYSGIKGILLDAIAKNEFSPANWSSFGDDYLGYRNLTIDHKYDPYPVIGKRDCKSERSDLYMHLFYNDIVHRNDEGAAVQKAIAAIRKVEKEDKLSPSDIDALKQYTDYEEKLSLGQESKTKLDLTKVRENTLFDGYSAFLTSRRRTSEEMYSIYKSRNAVEQCNLVWKGHLNMNRIGCKTDKGMQTARLCGFLATSVRCEILNRLTAYKEANSSASSKDDLRSVGTLLKALATIKVVRRNYGTKITREYSVVSGKNLLLFDAVGLTPPDTSVSISRRVNLSEEIKEELES